MSSATYLLSSFFSTTQVRPDTTTQVRPYATTQVHLYASIQVCPHVTTQVRPYATTQVRPYARAIPLKKHAQTISSVHFGAVSNLVGNSFVVS